MEIGKILFGRNPEDSKQKLLRGGSTCKSETLGFLIYRKQSPEKLGCQFLTCTNSTRIPFFSFIHIPYSFEYSQPLSSKHKNLGRPPL